MRYSYKNWLFWIFSGYILLFFSAILILSWINIKSNKTLINLINTTALIFANIDRMEPELSKTLYNELIFLISLQPIVITDRKDIPIFWQISEKKSSFNNDSLFFKYKTVFLDKNSSNIKTINPALKKELEMFISKNRNDGRDIALIRRIKDDIEIVGHLYYGKPYLQNKIKYLIIIESLLLTGFALLVIWGYKKAERTGREAVWITMAKEMAHQLGTPISGLSGILHLIKKEQIESNSISIIEKDMEKLKSIYERFALIGKKPELTNIEINEIINSTVEYFRTKFKDIEFEVFTQGRIEIQGNTILLQWVLENLFKNAIQAQASKIKIETGEEIKRNKRKSIIKICDNGSGIPESKRKEIFKTGFSLSKGWGIGLSLVKRIIEEYHNGSIKITSNYPKGTCFYLVFSRKI